MDKGKNVGKETTTSSGSATSEQEHNRNSNKKHEDNATKKVPFYKLFSFADTTDLALMIFGSIGAIANGLGMPLTSMLFGEIIDAFGQNQNTSHIIHVISKICLKFVYLAIGVAFAAFLQVACWIITGERQAGRIRNLYLRTILRQDIAFFDKETNTGEVVGRMSGDTVLIQNAMGEKVGKFIQLMSTFIGGFAVAFAKGWLLTLVMLSSIPFVATIAAIMNIIMSRMASRGQMAYAQAAIIVEEAIGSIRTVASFSREKRAIGDYNKAIVSAYKSGVHEGFAAGMGIGAFHLVIFGSYALAIWFGARMVFERNYTGGVVFNIIIAVMAGSMSLGEASPCMSAFAAGQTAAYKMFKTINRKPEIDSYDPSGEILDNIHGDIELRDVYFTYPTRHNEKILSGFSLSISSGTTAALVGQSGCGKSTVINLIERFYDPLSGQILIDGINLKEFQLRWIRQKIGLMSQEPVLFASTIRENIAYGKDDATDVEIRNAIMLANASKFIDKLSQGLDTLVGEHGTQLSGGQKQRVAIARAILKNPQILLLDEATSALDAESERVVQEALDRIMVNRTTIIVAHRLSTVRNAHMIAVIHQGKVVEKGSHSELLKDPEGPYSQLIRLQEMKEESQLIDNVKKISKQYSKRGSFSKLPEVTVDPSKSILPEQECVDFPTSKKPQKVSIMRLASLNKPEILVLLLGLISAIAKGVILPIFSIILASAVKVFYEPPHEMRVNSLFWALMFLLLGMASFVANPARAYFFAVSGCKLIKRIRSMCFERVLHMEVGWFDEPENSSGAIGAMLSTDAAIVRALVGDALGLLVENVVTAIVGLLIAFHANWLLSLLILGLLPLIALNEYLSMKFKQGFSVDAKKKYEEATQIASDAVGSIRTVVSFCAEDKITKLYEKKCEGPMETGIKQGLVSGAGFGLSFAMLYCVYSADFYAGAQLVGHGKTTFTDVFRVIFALTVIALGISQSSSFSTDTGKAKSAAASVFALLDRKSKIDPSDDSGMSINDVKGEIEFQHISFKYPTRPDVQIFRDFCLPIQAGKTVALVGESGSGKSTIISLMQRFYDPDSGSITLDGIKIQKLQLKWLRQQMGLVSQEPILFNDTIYANIAYGNNGNAVTEAEIIAAAKLANAHNFISSLHQGYDTIVGERGIQLSGGQKQRVAIARAIVKNPRILLLDEATSALDVESERVVQDALDGIMVNRTSLVVAHRLSTIKNADLIAVVKNGFIVEKGKHDGLIRIKEGVYASLVALHMTTLCLT